MFYPFHAILSQNLTNDTKLVILYRYLVKEVFYTMIAVTLIAIFIFICNLFVRYLGYVMHGKFAAFIVFDLVLMHVPILCGLLLPLGLFLGLLLGYGRLYADSEMTVMSACSFSRAQLFKVSMVMALIVAIIVWILVGWLGPYFYLKRDRILDIAESSTIAQTIMPGQFQASEKGNEVFYLHHLSKDRMQMKGLFIAKKILEPNAKEESLGQQWMIMVSQSGRRVRDSKTGERFIVGENGFRYVGTPGQKKLQKLSFDQYGQRLSGGAITQSSEGIEVVPTTKLFWKAFSSNEAMATLQWRISMPLMAFILTLLALPLSQVNPRQGRFAQLFPAILLYIVYANMMFVSRSWIEDGVVSPYVGILWLHLAFLILALFLLYRKWHLPFVRRRKA